MIRQTDKRWKTAFVGLIMIICSLVFGLDRYTAKFIRVFGAKEPCLILMYHDITQDESKCGSMTVTQDRLRSDIEWLSENGYTFILPSDLAGEEALPEKPVMITFDDGYLSNYTLAYPVLEETGAKANINVIASVIDSGEYAAFCSWEQLAEMADSGLVEIGSHTYNMHNPDTAGEAVTIGSNGVQKPNKESVNDFALRLTADLEKSVELIEKNTGQTVCCFAYPFGANDKYSKRIAEEMFDVTLCTYEGMANVYNHHGHNLPRNSVTMDTDIGELSQMGRGWFR